MVLGRNATVLNRPRAVPQIIREGDDIYFPVIFWMNILSPTMPLSSLFSGRRPFGRRVCRGRYAMIPLGIAVLCSMIVPAIGAEFPASSSSPPRMSFAQAVTLGLVEGLTEFLPVSSTGHLFIVERLMGLASNATEQSVSDSFGIAIQLGAILAVIALYPRRMITLLRGAIGRDASGTRLDLRLLLAFLPAALFALLFQGWIRKNLFGPWPIVIAWVAGGIVILIVGRRRRVMAAITDIEHMSPLSALGIGVAQSLALWPGVSRSLVTIAGGLALGLEGKAAVEFSFLLGLLTLGAATVQEIVQRGGQIVAFFGWWRPITGLVVASVSAWVSMRWMLDYLQRHGFALFGWYRIAIAVVVALLLVGGHL